MQVPLYFCSCNALFLESPPCPPHLPSLSTILVVSWRLTFLKNYFPIPANKINRCPSRVFLVCICSDHIMLYFTIILAYRSQAFLYLELCLMSKYLTQCLKSMCLINICGAICSPPNQDTMIHSLAIPSWGTTQPLIWLLSLEWISVSVTT